MDATKKLAQYAADLDYDLIPKQVVEKTKELVLDQLGCQLAGSTLSWSQWLLEHLKDTRSCKEEGTVVHYGLKTSVHDAVFANASFGRSTEVDDIDEISKCHIGSAVIPTALVVGESKRINGKKLIESVIAGYDVASRIGAAVRSAMGRGFHTTTVIAPISAAVTAGVVLKLNSKDMRNAIGIASSHSSGLMEFSLSGGSVNRLHGGIGASGGTRSAYLAQKGFDAPESTLEGNKGLCSAFANEDSREELTRDLGDDYRLLSTGLRRYCCCGTQNAGLDALDLIIKAHNFKAEEIQEILVQVPKTIIRLVGTIVEPKDLTSAQYSGRFGIALRLLRGKNNFMAYYQNDNLNDPSVLKLIKRIRYILDDELEQLPFDIPTKLTVKLKNRHIFTEQVNIPKGSIHNPMARDEKLKKFMELASTVFGNPDEAGMIVETVEKLDELDDIRKLIGLLVNN